MATWAAAFHADILAEAEGCSNILATNVARLSAIEFCRKTGCYETMLTPAVTIGVAIITPVPPSGTVIAEVREVRHDGQRLMPKTIQQLDAGLGAGWRTVQAEKADWYIRPDAARIRIVYAPSKAGALECDVTLAPSAMSTSLDDTVIEENFEAIVAGAKYRLLTMNGKPWYNPQLAAKYLSDFNRAIGNVSARVKRSRTGAVLIADQVEFG